MEHQSEKLLQGCRFQSYYPITPATDESDFLERNEILEINEDRPGSTLVVQTEDEISAIGMAIGSSLTGTRSSTCTSGPGFSLMAESLKTGRNKRNSFSNHTVPKKWSFNWTANTSWTR